MLTASRGWRNSVNAIVEVLGDPRRAENFYPPGLTEAVLGPRSRFPVGFSVYFLLMQPPVAVDFEPSPLDDVPLMHCEAKRKWCHEHGIVYVPVFLPEKLSKEQFEERVQIERQALERGQRVLRDERALDAVAVAPHLDTLEIDREALRRLALEIAVNPALRGATRTRRLTTIKRDVHGEWVRRRARGVANPL